MEGRPTPGTLALGAHLAGDTCQFTVWAPRAEQVDVHLLGPHDRVVPMHGLDHGYFTAQVTEVGPGDRYWYRLDGDRERPDPASRHQPDGVADPSAVVDADWMWHDGAWRGVGLDELVLYELHVGTYTQAGTFDAVIDHLEHLAGLGVTAIELMPIAEFPGERNWGYDGVGLFAAQSSYGGPDGLRRLVDAAHGAGIAVVLDVVYNHLGPEGNHLAEFGPYFTGRYRTPWGDAVNIDGAGSDEVRRFFIESALMWVADYHVDGFRLDAVHAIADSSASPFVEELATAIHARADELGRQVLVIAEDASNDPRLSRPADQGGRGLDAQWNDDFHHAVHVTLTGEQQGYYRDFAGYANVAASVRDGFVFGRRHSVYRNHRVGRPVGDADPSRLVVYSQNHDQTGNRAMGERLITLAGPAAARAAATLVVLSPGIPLLFMGEEWAETAPFLYFVDHTDRDLLDAVRAGRRSEFAAFGQHDDVSDPADPATFECSRVDHRLRTTAPGTSMRAWYEALFAVRRQHRLHGTRTLVREHGTALLVVIGDRTLHATNLGPERVTFDTALPPGRWQPLLDSGEPRFGGLDDHPSSVDPATDPVTIDAAHHGAGFTLAPWASVVLGRQDTRGETASTATESESESEDR